MLNSYYTEKLLGLQGVETKNITESQEKYEIAIEQPRKACVCPCCGQRTDKEPDFFTPILTKSQKIASKNQKSLGLTVIRN